MAKQISTAELEAFLEEALPVEKMALIEEMLRTDQSLQTHVSAINGRRDAGVHSLGEIWRRRRLSCPTREQLGSYLLGVLDEGHIEYVRFHVEKVGCRYCNANLEDLASLSEAADAQEVQKRRHKYFHSSVAYLKDK